MPQFPGTIDLSSLNGSNGFRLSGVAANNQSGTSVASAGDINGDGFADAIVGAPGANANGTPGGASYVVFGKASGFAANIDLSSLDGSNGFALAGVAAGDSSGTSVAPAGDINGDGIADLIVGAPDASNAQGVSYVVFGNTSGFAATVNLSSLNGSNGFAIAGTDGKSGWSVDGAGDVNGDGFADVIIGAFGASPNGSQSGASYVVFGKASGFAASLSLSSLNGSNGFQLSGVARDDKSGGSVASAGDVNGDGFDDVIVGAPYTNSDGSENGSSYVVFGKASGFAANLNLSSLDGSNGFQLTGVDSFDNSGWSVAGAGDVNGDGFDDVIVGAPGADPNGNQSGQSYVVFGKASGFAASFDLAGLNGSNGFRLSGPSLTAQSGWSVAAAGDVDGDGFDDVIVGAPGADPNGGQSGQSFVVYGKAVGFTPNLDLSSLDGSNGFRLNGVATGDASGRSVAAAGDLNDDGFADLIIGASFADPHGNSAAGASYVVFGAPPDSSVERKGTSAAQTLAGGAFDDTLSGLGGNDRLFGNGGNDVLLGGEGDDTVSGGVGADRIDLGTGADILRDALSDLQGDRVAGFGFDDMLDIRRAHLGWDQFVFDRTADGVGVTVGGSRFGFTGDFSQGEFMAVARGNGPAAHTVVTYEPFLPTLQEGVRVDPASINGVTNEPYLTGDGAVRFTVELKSAVSAFHNTLGVYKVAADGTIGDVHILFNDTLNVAAGARSVDLGAPGNGETLGFFLIQNGASAYGALLDNLSFVAPGTITPADLDSGVAPILRSATLGNLAGAPIFHSFATLNTGDANQVLSGVAPGGRALLMGFEDLPSASGDNDFQDVILSIVAHDSILG